MDLELFDRSEVLALYPAFRRGQPFSSTGRKRWPTELIIHEPAIATLQATEASLRRNGYGVHYSVDVNGDIIQYNDPIRDRCSHCPEHNTTGVGIEVVNSYRPHPDWPDRIKASWAHEGGYSVPPTKQLRSLATLVVRLQERLQIPAAYPAAHQGLRTFRMGQLDGEQIRGMTVPGAYPGGGVWAHQHAGGHSDGAYPCLVLCLVQCYQYSVPDARAWAMEHAAGRRREIALP